MLKVNQTLSTNNLLWEMLTIQTYQNGFSIIAEAQTKGKGQKGNSWFAAPGKNLTCSILVNPNLDTKKVFFLNIIASLSIQKTLEDYKIYAKVKWPNDIMVKDQKIAGILIENQVQGLKIKNTVIGIGLNTNQTDFPGTRPITSLQSELGKNFKIEEVFKKLYQYLDYFFDILVQQNFDFLESQYLQHMYRYNTWNEFSTKQLGRFSGAIQGIDDHGRLKLKTIEGKTLNFDFQTIQFL